MQVLTLEQGINEFLIYIAAKLRYKTYNKASVKKALQKHPVKESAALRREDILPLLERYHKALNERNLSDNLFQSQSLLELQDCISVSYKSYTKYKNTIKNIFWDFALFLKRKYNIDLVLDFSEGHSPSTTFERQIAIVKMLHHHSMSSMEIAEKLEISQRAAVDYLTKINSDSMDEGLIINNQKVRLEWDRKAAKYKYIATAHPLVLTPNLRQVIALLEGLFAMQHSGHGSYAYNIAQNIWNQLTEYAKKRIKENIEPLRLTAIWYEQLESGNNDLTLYQTERDIYQQSGNRDLAYLIKCERNFSFKYRENGDVVTYSGKPIRLNDDKSGIYVKLFNTLEEVLLLGQDIIEISD